MTSNIFEHKIKPKGQIIVFGSSHGSSLNYKYTDTNEIYIASDLELFKAYIERVINLANDEITVIIIFKSFKKLFPILKFLNSFEKGKTEFKKSFVRQYSYYTKQLQKDSLFSEGELKIEIKTGQCDQPCGFNLHIVLDSSIWKHDHLSSNSITYQQFIRFIALKHGGSVIGTTDVTLLLKSPELLLKISKEPQPNILEDNIFFIREIPISLSIPKGWDSWNKMKILAKSSFSSDENKLLLNDSDFHEFNSIYDQYLNGTENVMKILNFTPDPKEIPVKQPNEITKMSWDQFLTKILDE